MTVLLMLVHSVVCRAVFIFPLCLVNSMVCGAVSLTSPEMSVPTQLKRKLPPKPTGAKRKGSP